ncbi:MAG: hypothetical protein ACLVKR_04750 [Lachnospiraceae bacterium]
MFGLTIRWVTTSEPDSLIVNELPQDKVVYVMHEDTDDYGNVRDHRKAAG